MGGSQKNRRHRSARLVGARQDGATCRGDSRETSRSQLGGPAAAASASILLTPSASIVCGDNDDDDGDRDDRADRDGGLRFSCWPGRALVWSCRGATGGDR